MNKQISSTLLFTVLLLSSASEASLIGSEFLLQQQLDGEVHPSSGTVIVEEGPADSFDMFIGSNTSGSVGYIIDINSSNINIDFYRTAGGDGRFSGATFNGLYFSSMDFNANKFIETAIISQNQFGFNESRIVLFDNNSVGLNFSGLGFYDTSSVSITFDSSVVPIPPAIWLFGSGLLGIAGLARRKQ